MPSLQWRPPRMTFRSWWKKNWPLFACSVDLFSPNDCCGEEDTLLLTPGFLVETRELFIVDKSLLVENWSRYLGGEAATEPETCLWYRPSMVPDFGFIPRLVKSLNTVDQSCADRFVTHLPTPYPLDLLRSPIFSPYLTIHPIPQ